MGWVDARATGRGPLVVEWRGQVGLADSSWSFNGSVLGPGQWARVRADLSVVILQDSYDLTVEQARRAVVPALVLWAQETGWGEHEWNYNVSNMHCPTADASDGNCVRFTSSSERLQAYASLMTGVEVFWGRVSRISLALRHLGAGGDLEPLFTPTGPWARISPGACASLWDQVVTYLADGREDRRAMLPSNPYRTGRGRSVASSASGTRKVYVAAAAVMLFALVIDSER